jgi:hypothetical protein
MFDWRQHKRENDWRGIDRGWRCPQARLRVRFLLGALVGLTLLALPLAAEEIAKVEPDVGLNARSQAFWAARIKEDYAAQYGLFEPKVRRELSLADYIKGQGPVQYLDARIEGVTIDEAKALLTVRTLIRIKYPPLDQRKHEIVVREEWVKRQGEWYRVHPQTRV